MQKTTQVIKGNVNLTQIKLIKTFAELGATKKLFEYFWAGQYVRIIDTALDEYEHVFPFEKSIKMGATSWLSGRVVENNAYLIYSIYKIVAPHNADLDKALEPDDLSLVATIYNIKYYNNSPLIITKVHSLLNGLIKSKFAPIKTFISKQEGISLHKCACGNTFVARCSTATATCQWCRSKIKFLAKRKNIENHQNKPIMMNISAIALMYPDT
jgi:hypothetical protein